GGKSRKGMPRAGLEPALPSREQLFKSCVSARFTTAAGFSFVGSSLDRSESARDNSDKVGLDCKVGYPSGYHSCVPILTESTPPSMSSAGIRNISTPTILLEPIASSACWNHLGNGSARPEYRRGAFSDATG